VLQLRRYERISVQNRRFRSNGASRWRCTGTLPSDTGNANGHWCVNMKLQRASTTVWSPKLDLYIRMS